MLLQAPQRLAPVPGNHYFNFWDMDDTAINLLDFSIKNPHLLLPLMLYQTYRPNQHIGIMTNRSPQDDVVDYTVKQFLTDLKSFGIIIPQAHVVFGGGENARPAGEDYAALKKSVDVLTAQLQSLAVTSHRAAFLQQTTELSALYNLILETKFEGKNYLFIQFLNNHYIAERDTYEFSTGLCKREDLIVTMMDDLKTIAKPMNNMGPAFFCVQAAPGGKAPAKGTEEENQYYSVDYLHKMAQRIGFCDYALELVSDPEKHQSDHPLLQFAGLLYLWQLGAEACKVAHFQRLHDSLQPAHLNHAFNLLHYLDSTPYWHPQARFKMVTELVHIFKPRADREFLASAMIELGQIDIELAALMPIRQPDEPPEKKSGFSSFLQRLPSRSKSVASTSASEELPLQNDQAIKALEAKKKALMARIEQLCLSPAPDIAEQANHLFKTLKTRASSEQASPATVATSSTSTRSGSAILGRRSYTPAADVALAAAPVPTHSSAGSLLELEDKVLKDRRSARKSGSTLK